MPRDFDPASLTREGLAQSRDEYADFYEPGDQPVFLVSDPKTFRSCAGSGNANLAGLSLSDEVDGKALLMCQPSHANQIV